MISEVKSFFKKEKNPATSEIFSNPSGRYVDGVLEIKGTAKSFSITVQGAVDKDEDVQWTDLCVISENTLEGLTLIQTKGIYYFSCAGKDIRVVCSAVRGGDITATGKFIG